METKMASKMQIQNFSKMLKFAITTRYTQELDRVPWRYFVYFPKTDKTKLRKNKEWFAPKKKMECILEAVIFWDRREESAMLSHHLTYN